mmetsp:Transcript_73280/g.214978  ORF Transcript_73280/g.214978 Transcript_73280/m.214978 type:complete len:287 (-) Transcript_73280:745-1605(-)
MLLVHGRRLVGERDSHQERDDQVASEGDEDSAVDFRDVQRHTADDANERASKRGPLVQTPPVERYDKGREDLHEDGRLQCDHGAQVDVSANDRHTHRGEDQRDDAAGDHRAGAALRALGALGPLPARSDAVQRQELREDDQHRVRGGHDGGDAGCHDEGADDPPRLVPVDDVEDYKGENLLRIAQFGVLDTPNDPEEEEGHLDEERGEAEDGGAYAERGLRGGRHRSLRIVREESTLNAHADPELGPTQADLRTHHVHVTRRYVLELLREFGEATERGVNEEEDAQ